MRSNITFWWWSYNLQGLSFSLVESCHVLWVVNHIAVHDWRGMDFTEARDSEWQWHQLGRMQVCISLQTDNPRQHPTTQFLQAGCPSCCPTNSVNCYFWAYPSFYFFVFFCFYTFLVVGSVGQWIKFNSSNNVHCCRLFSSAGNTTTLPRGSEQASDWQDCRFSVGRCQHRTVENAGLLPRIQGEL